jgi:predicted nucleic acid-binding protein
MLDAVFLLAREQGLSSYDAAYLDLAIQNGLQLVTLDQSLQKAAARKGVGLYMADSI